MAQVGTPALSTLSVCQVDEHTDSLAALHTLVTHPSTHLLVRPREVSRVTPAVDGKDSSVTRRWILEFSLRFDAPSSPPSHPTRLDSHPSTRGRRLVGYGSLGLLALGFALSVSSPTHQILSHWLPLQSSSLPHPLATSFTHPGTNPCLPKPHVICRMALRGRAQRLVANHRIFD